MDSYNNQKTNRAENLTQDQFSRQQLVLLDQLNLLCTHSSFSLVSSLILAAFVCTVTWPVINHQTVIAWFSALSLIVIARLFLAIAFKKRQIKAPALKTWLDYFTIGACLTGIVWGGAGFFLFAEHDIAIQLFLAVVICGVTSGSLAALTPIYRAATLFIIPTLIPISTQGFLHAQDTIHLAIGVMPLLYLIFLVMQAKRMNLALVSSLSMKYEKTELIEYLQAEVAERKRVEIALFAEKERAQVTLESIGDAVITTDPQMRVEYLNPIAETLTGWSNASAHGRPMSEIFNIIKEGTDELAVNPIEECLQDNRIVEMENHTILVRSDGAQFHIEDSAAPIRQRNGEVIGAVMVFHDVSERKQAQRHLDFLAYHDSLTGLPNRALFRDRLENSIANAERYHQLVAILFLDLDRFKSINDSLGHDIGDMLLMEVAARLKGCVRDDDTVARLGGDEFVVILNGLKDTSPASEVALNIHAVLNEPFNIQGYELFITTSIGITFYPGDGQTVEALLKNADTAMYRAKDLGSNAHYFYTSNLSEKSLERLRLSNALRGALERKEFHLHYQPMLDLKKGSVVGVEALLRWSSAEHGEVLPTHFIPLLEESGLIVEVGEWVLRKAVEQVKAWQLAGYPPIRIAVNLSARQFRKQDFPEFVRKVLREVKLEPKYLELELTESMLIENAEASLWLTELKSSGVHVSIDDFGTGYSSLSYLRRFPIDVLKIDKSFIRDINIDPHDNSIIRAIIALARSMGMKVVAEGVESEEQLAFLLEQDCDEIQGFWLSTPLPAERFQTWLQNREGMRAEMST